MYVAIPKTTHMMPRTKPAILRPLDSSLLIPIFPKIIATTPKMFPINALRMIPINALRIRNTTNPIIPKVKPIAPKTFPIFFSPFVVLILIKFFIFSIKNISNLNITFSLLNSELILNKSVKNSFKYGNQKM